MKRRNKLISLLLAAMLTFPAAPYTTAPANNMASVVAEAATKKAEITNVKTGTLTIEKGETFQLKSNRSNVKWKSSNQKIVTVSKSGKLKGIKEGTAKVTLTAGKSKVSIDVTVGTKVSNVNVIKSAVALPVGLTSTIKADIAPSNASNQTLAYQSNNAKIASVSKEGVITAKKTGRTKITVLATDGSKKKEVVTVTVYAADSTIRMQDDFFQAVNTSTIAAHPLAADQSEWNNFYELQTKITEDLSGLIDELVTKKDTYSEGSIQQKIIDFYLLDRDMDTRDKLGIAPLRPYLDQIDQAQTVAEFVDVLAQLEKFGVSSVINFGIAQDSLDSNKYVLTDLGPSYGMIKDYFQEGADQPIPQALLAYIRQLFLLSGESEEKASQIAEEVFQMHQEFSNNGLGLEDRYNIEKIYHPYTKDELISLYSNCDIEGFLKTIGITNFDKCIVQGVENAKLVNSYLTPEHLDSLKNYTKYALYDGFCGFLTSAHTKAANDFNLAVAGTVEEKSTDTTAKEQTQQLFAWEFGKLYTDKYFPEENKKDVEDITKQLIQTFRGRIQKLNWLSEATKQKAITKLDAMKIKIGYPDKWPSYLDDIPVDSSKGLIENIINITVAANATVQQQLDAGVDKTEWITTPQTVNAFYNPQANDITFPAAILQAPFYDKNADYAQNLGAIGTIIGHEITHAFDTNGAGYDENGNYSNWWTQEDMEQFTARAELVKNYYNKMEVESGVFQNGDTTITENIADMGGMACVLELVGDDKEAQRKLFLSNANVWAGNTTQQYRDLLLMADVHSLNKVRVNAVLPLFDQFYDVFGITETDAMYVAPEDRIQIW